MSIALDSYCLLCHLRRNIELVRPLGTEEQTMAFAREMMRMYLSAPEGVSAPWFGPKVADMLHQYYGLEIDRYRQEKQDSNRFILEHMEQVRQRIRAAQDPVFAGLQFAILGNYLADTLLWNEYLVTAMNMAANFILEYLYDRFVVFRKSLDTNSIAKKHAVQ